MAVNATPTPHDQRIQQMITALQNLQALNATDTLTESVVAVFVPLIKELISIRMSLLMLPLPNNMKNLDS